MKATRAFAGECFDKYNSMIFGDTLPQVPIRLSRAKGFLGQLKFKIKRHLLKPNEYYDFTLHINARFDLPQDVIEDVIIHEMIHLYIHYHGIADDAPHGTRFKSIMNKINATHGRNITVRHKTTDEELNSDTHRRPHIICVALMHDGRELISVCARTKVFAIDEALKSWQQVVAVEWYLCYDPFFNRYPQSRSVKLYEIDTMELHEHLKQNARQLECDGHIMRLKK